MIERKVQFYGGYDTSDHYTYDWTFSNSTTWNRLGSADSLIKPDGTIVNRPSSGQISFTVQIQFQISANDNYVVTSGAAANPGPNTFDSFFTDPDNIYRDMMRVANKAGQWSAATTVNATIIFDRSGEYSLANGSISGSGSLSLAHGVKSILVTCGLRDGNSYVFDGLATPSPATGETRRSPTWNHTWNDYSSNTYPTLNYYCGTELLVNMINVRNEILIDDIFDGQTYINYTIPFAKNYFSDNLDPSLILQSATNYKHYSTIPSELIEVWTGFVNNTLITKNIKLSDYSNGTALSGTVCWLFTHRDQLDYFYWDNNGGSLDDTLIASGLPISTGLTASNWNRLQAKINEVQSAFGTEITPFTNVSSGDIILASHFNSIVSGLSVLPSAAIPILPSYMSQGDAILARLFNGTQGLTNNDIKAVLNNAIQYYNNTH